MDKKNAYNFFIGLLALMLSLMLVIEIFIYLPKEVRWTFYYIDNIVRLIFIGDYFARLAISERKREFIKINIIDLLSIIPLRAYIRFVNLTILPMMIKGSTIIKGLRVIMLFICAIKFKLRAKNEMLKSRLNLLLVISTIVIVIGAVIISLVEGMSIGDAIWWSFVTFTTVGYGDIILKTQLGRSIGILLMVIGIGIIGVITTTLTLNIFGERKKKNPTYKEKIIDDIKDMLDRYEELTDEEIDKIAEIIKSLK